MTLSFWYLLQESLWTVEYPTVEDSGGSNADGADQMAVASALYMELVVILKRKVTWPSAVELTNWTRGMVTLSFAAPFH